MNDERWQEDSLPFGVHGSALAASAQRAHRSSFRVHHFGGERNQIMKTRIVLLILLALAAGGLYSAPDRKAEAASDSSAAGQTQRFITVEGADLKSKLDSAIKQGRARAPQTRFWVAYSFDVRSGIAVDPGEAQFSGSMENFGGVTVFTGTSNGVTVETRNLGVFLLFEPNDNSIARVEIYNLDRQREYSGYPVYWLGRAGNEESLNYLKTVADSSKAKRASENATVAIGLHDDLRVVAMLKDSFRKSSNQDVREAAIYWIGVIGGEQAFLSDIVRNEQENTDVRESAASAIGRSREASLLPTLEGLYKSVNNRDVKEQIVGSISKNENQKGATAFLLKVAKTDTDRDLRETAVHRLGRIPGTSSMLVDIIRNEQEHSDVREAAVQAIGKNQDAASISTLQNLYGSVSDHSTREQIINSVSKNPNQDAALAFLAQVAKSDPNRELREEAVLRLGRMPNTHSLLVDFARNENEDADVRGAAVQAIGKSQDAAALSALENLYGSVSNREVKEEIINSVSKNSDRDAAITFLIKVADADADRDLKQEAIMRLGKTSSARGVEALNRIANSATVDAESQEEAVLALSRSGHSEAVPMLIQIAKSHPREEVREAAINRLAKSSDERARDFVKQVLSK
jgi:HEAT repeat protein